MPGLRDTLDRFRRAGTPGPAARAGVPVDRTAELTTELEPVLARLSVAQAECRRVRSLGAREAAQIHVRARERAASIVADAQRRADAVRAEAAAQIRAEGETESARLIAAATEQAETTRATAEQRIAAYVDRVVTLVLASAEDGGPPPATWEHR